MERKLVKHGESTLMISVPAKWARRNKLSKGDSVEMADEGNTLVVARKGNRKVPITREVSFTTPDYHEVRAVLSRCYRAGIDEVKVSYEHDETFQLVHRVVSSILSYHIIETSKRGCVIKNVAKDLDIDVQRAIKKLEAIIKHSFVLTRDTITGKQQATPQMMTLLRDEAHKFRDASYVILRNDTLGAAYRDTLLTHLFEQNTTFLSWIVKRFPFIKQQSVSNQFLTLFDSIEDFFRTSLVMMGKGNQKYVHYAMNEKRRLLAQCARLSRKGGGEAELALYLSMLIYNILIMKSVVIE